MPKWPDFFDDYTEDQMRLLLDGHHIWNLTEEKGCVIPDNIGDIVKDARGSSCRKRYSSNKVYKRLGDDSHAFLTVSEDSSGNASGVGVSLFVDNREYYINIREGAEIVISRTNAAAACAEQSVKKEDMRAAGNMLKEYGLYPFFPDAIDRLVEDK